MSEKDIRNLILLGIGGVAVYFLFFRKNAVALPFPVTAGVAPQLPGTIEVTPQIFGTNALPQGSLSPQGFPATPNDSGNGTQYDYVLTE